MALVPAVMALLGRRVWALPGWLDRVMPNVDVEGEKLRQALEGAQPSSGVDGGSGDVRPATAKARTELTRNG